MEKMKNKKVLITMILIFLIIFFLILSLFFKSDKSNQKEELTNSLEQMAKEFYENFYYQQIGKDKEEITQFLQKYESIGIKINLDNLSRYNSEKNGQIIDKFVNNKTNEKCDRTNTKAVIYPKSPYEKNSYTVEIILSCGEL